MPLPVGLRERILKRARLWQESNSLASVLRTKAKSLGVRVKELLGKSKEQALGLLFVRWK
jgi:hypothetical protein